MNCRVALTRLEVEGPAARRHAAPLHSCKYRWLHARDLNPRRARRSRPFVAHRARTCGRLQELARLFGTGVRDRHRPAIGRESRPRFSGVGCEVWSLPPACHASRCPT